MIKCTWCGREYPNAFDTCPDDFEPLVPIEVPTGAEPPPNQNSSEALHASLSSEATVPVPRAEVNRGVFGRRRANVVAACILTIFLVGLNDVPKEIQIDDRGAIDVVRHRFPLTFRESLVVRGSSRLQEANLVDVGQIRWGRYGYEFGGGATDHCERGALCKDIGVALLSPYLLFLLVEAATGRGLTRTHLSRT